MTQEALIAGYPYLSPCWGELNYVRCYKYPILFTGLAPDTPDSATPESTTPLSSAAADVTDMLTYAGSLRVPFEPGSLVQDEEGLLLHPLLGHKYLEYGALDMQLSMLVGEGLREDGEGYTWRGREYQINKVHM